MHPPHQRHSLFSNRKLWNRLSILSFLCLGSLTAEKPTPCGLEPSPYRIALRHIEANGIGYNTGYTTLEAFLAKRAFSFWTLFFDARGHLFNDGYWAANGGLGARYLGFGHNWAWGGNLYYDFRNTKHLSYNQLGMGWEALHPIWEFRVNGYIPVGGRISAGYNTTFHRFQGNHLLLQQKKEVALYGADAEGGGHFARVKEFDFYSGIGPYCFGGSEGETLVGGKFRLNVQWKDYFALEGTFSYDRIFRDLYQGQVTLNFPFGPQKKIVQKSSRSCHDSLLLADRLVQPVTRDEIIVVEKVKKTSVAINPTTNAPIQIWFVNNQSSSAGTIESPFPTLAAAEAASSSNDVIYLFPGDGTSTGMNQGIVLKDNQRLLGAGLSHSFATTLGTVNAPAQAIGLPRITKGSPVITIANGNEISGLYIVGGVGAGGVFHAASPTPALGLSVNRNLLETGGGRCVVLFDVGGLISIQNNQCSGTHCISIEQSNTPIAIDCAVATNQIVCNGGSAGISVTRTIDSDATTNLAILNNTIANPSQSANAIDLNFSGRGIDTVQVAQNTVTIARTGLTFSSAGVNSIETLTVVDNLFMNGSAGKALNATTIDSQQANFLIERNVFTANNGAVSITSDGSSTLCLQFNNNTGTSPTDDFLLTQSGASQFNVTSLDTNTGPLTTSGTITLTTTCD
jgi:hypothetical protein